MSDEHVADVRGRIFTAAQVLAKFPDLTYRVLARWADLGYVHCSFPPDGSGSVRMFTEGDVASVQAVWDACARAQDIMAEVRSGKVGTDAWVAAIRDEVNR